MTLFSTIDEYRDHFFSEKEEWDFIYNPKRCSIEVLNKIEVKNKGNGPIKKKYDTEFECNTPGPYYDPNFLHIHVWKSFCKIKNFTCEQKCDVPHIEFTNTKSGIFCVICHCKNKNQSFKWSKPLYDTVYEEQDIYVNRNGYTFEDNMKNPRIFPVIEVKKEPSKWLDNWKNLLIKIKYLFYDKFVVYPVTEYKSLIITDKKMTDYQRLKLKESDYKKSCIFIKSSLLKFKTDYAFIF